MLLDLSRLVAGPAALDPSPRSGRAAPPGRLAPSLVTWYAAGGRDALTTAEGLALVDGVAASDAPLLRLVGAPLARADAFELVAQARLHGLPVAVAARPAELDAPTVARLRAFAVDDVHVTLWPRRGAEGPPLASELRAAADAYRRCVAAGQRAALALPLTRGVADALDAVLDVAELNGVARLVFTRRHARSVRTPPGAPLGLLESRAAVATLIARARRWAARGAGTELSLAGDLAAGPYAVLLLAHDDPDAAPRAVAELERRAARAASEVTVDPAGRVSLDPDDPDGASSLGSVRAAPFDALWRAHVAAAHRAAPRALPVWPKPRCPACQWVDVCGVAGRVEARAAGGAAAPAARVSAACYLSDAEAGLTGVRVREPEAVPAD